MRWDDLASVDAIIFGTPTYVAGVLSRRLKRSKRHPRMRS